MAAPQLHFKLGKYTAGKFDNTDSQHLIHKEGVIYLATNDLFSAHLIYDDGKNFLDIIPRMLGYHNGGVGTDLTAAPPNATFIQGFAKNKMSWVASANGAYYSTGTDATPIFGTLPVGCGGTGATTFTSGGVLYAQVTKDTKVIKATDKGDTSALLVGGDGTPKFVTPSVSWVAGTDKGPTFRLGINGTNYDAVIPSASATAAGIVTNSTQTFGGQKTFNDGITVNGSAIFNGGFSIVAGSDAYYNSSNDQSTGSLSVTGGITSTMNMRVDGGTIQFKKAGKIQYDDTKECFNFVFM